MRHITSTVQDYAVPSLTGTAEEIAVAEEVRQEAIAELSGAWAAWSADPEGFGQPGEPAYDDALMGLYLTITEASWWLDLQRLSHIPPKYLPPITSWVSTIYDDLKFGLIAEPIIAVEAIYRSGLDGEPSFWRYTHNVPESVVDRAAGMAAIWDGIEQGRST